MKLLLDTQLLLWAAGETRRLTVAARKLINDERNELFFSAASLWEISIKNGLGREDFHVEASVLRRSLVDNGYSELPITGEHAVTVENLPNLHRDPFDRMLLAQAIAEGITLVTTDSAVARYPGPIRKV